MAEAPRDQNHVTSALFESSTTPGLTIPGKIIEATGRIKVDNGGTGGGVESVTGLNTDNADPANPIVKISVDGVTITGQGTPGDPLVAVASGGGTVTGVIIATANGLAGMSDGDPTTPTITLSTTVTGILKGNGTAISAAAAGTDYTNLAFKTWSVSGQSDVVADSAEDTMTFVAGTNMTITTDATTDTITFNATGGGSGGNGFAWFIS